MKKIFFAIIAVAMVCSFAACNKSETYAKQRNKELDSISAFIRNEKITVISEEAFKARFEAGNSVLTDTTKNEYVLINSNGVYMQIVEQGCGDYIKQGETKPVLVRFDEYNLSYEARISTNSLSLSNNVPYYSYKVDKMFVTNTSGTFSGSFDGENSLLNIIYNASSYTTSGYTDNVPSGWLTPFTWIKVGRPTNENEKIAHVRLIVPHSYGTTTASGNVHACFYNLYIQAGR